MPAMFIRVGSETHGWGPLKCMDVFRGREDTLRKQVEEVTRELEMVLREKRTIEQLLRDGLIEGE